MPTYKGAAHLRAAIDSVLAQTFADFELVVIDDNSPDDTPAIVATYSDPRIRYLRNERNLGPQGNWNRCREEARGRYFKLMPQDDLLAPDCLAEQRNVLERDAEHSLALVFGARDIVDVSDQRVMRRAAFGRKAARIEARSLIRSCIRRGTNLIGEPGNVLLRRELVERIGPFDATYGYMVDLDYWFRALQLGDAYYLPMTLSAFRISGGSWSVAIGARQYQEFRDFARKYAGTLEYRIGQGDLALGTLMSWVNARARQWIYRWLLR
jgi:glycosyltransferase involved in cell wall biosynthesis